VNLRPENAAKVDAYVDGALSVVEREAIEREMQSDRALAEEVRLQQWIDRELAGMFAYEPAEVAPPAPIPIAGRRAWWAALAVAAVVVLAGVAAWLALGRGGKPSRPERLFGPDAVYARMEARNFEPTFVCKDNAEFAAAVQKRLGSPLVIDDDPGVKVLGWAYSAEFPGRIIGEKTMILMCRLAEAHSVVLMDEARADRPLSLPAGSNLHLFRRQIGALVLYEVTPLDSPRVLDRLRPPGG
jgi:hypothetical protein